MAIEKLQINVPVTARLKYADEAEGNYGMQVKVRTEDDRVYYLPIACANDLLALGAKREETDKGATYRPLPQKKVVILKAQASDEKHPSTTVRLEGAEPVPELTEADDALPPAVAPRETPATVERTDAKVVKEWDRVVRHVYTTLNALNTEHPEGIQFTAAEVATSANGLMISIARGL